MSFTVDASYLIMGLITGGFYSLLVLGFSLGWATVRMPDISYIAFVYMAGELVAILCNMFKVEPLLLSPLISILYFGIGVLLYKMLISFLLKKMPEPGLVGLTLTFGLAIILENLMIVIFTPDFRSVTSAYRLTIAGMTLTPYHILTLPLAVIVTLSIYYLVFKHVWGIKLRAAVQEPVGAALCGIDSDKIRAITYGIVYSIGGFTGVLIPVLQYVHPSAMWNVMPVCFIVSTLGGIGSIVGTLVVGTFVGLVVSFSSALLPAAWISTELFLMLILILLFRPRGLFKGLG